MDLAETIQETVEELIWLKEAKHDSITPWLSSLTISSVLPLPILFHPFSCFIFKSGPSRLNYFRLIQLNFVLWNQVLITYQNFSSTSWDRNQNKTPSPISNKFNVKGSNKKKFSDKNIGMNIFHCPTNPVPSFSNKKGLNICPIFNLVSKTLIVLNQ
jgi:hypothetical protein